MEPISVKFDHCDDSVVSEIGTIKKGTHSTTQLIIVLSSKTNNQLSNSSATFYWDLIRNLSLQATIEMATLSRGNLSSIAVQLILLSLTAGLVTAAPTSAPSASNCAELNATQALTQMKNGIEVLRRVHVSSFIIKSNCFVTCMCTVCNWIPIYLRWNTHSKLYYVWMC